MKSFKSHRKDIERKKVQEDLSAGQKSIKLAKTLFEPIAHTLRTEIS